MSSVLRPLDNAIPVCPGEFGSFQDGGRTFVINNPVTPAAWVNILANDHYGLVLSQSGSGFSWHENCQLFRLNRWQNDIIDDRQGRFIYMLDVDSGDLWSTTHQPTLVEGVVDEIHHSIGSTKFVRERTGIRSEQTTFVPLADTCDVSIVTLANNSGETRRLRIVTYLEWFLGQAGQFHREFYRLFIETKSDGNVQCAWSHPGLDENKRNAADPGPTAFVAVNGVDILDWSSDKQAFLGHPARLDRPAGVTEGTVSSNGRWEDPCASASAEITLRPGETVSFTVVIGASLDQAAARRLGQKYSVAAAQTELQNVRAYWTNLCETSTIETGEPGIDVMGNFWLRYQVIAGRMVARCAYYQQGGAFGFRDQLQDSLSLLSIDPAWTKKQLLIHAEATYEDGGVRHWWHPNTQIFAESKHSDTCLWLSYGTLDYLEETNDLHSLETSCRYLSRETQKWGGAGTWLDHCFRGIDRALALRSSRGLPLIQAGDWNDGLSHAGLDMKGESVWVGMFLYDILMRWAAILPDLGLSDKARSFLGEADDLAEAVNKHGWDGEWYLEGTCDDGRPLGSRENACGQIFLNTQTWAVLTGIAPADRQLRAMKSVRERLLKPYGVLLLNPAFDKVDPWVGYITRYAPGSRENGGVYSHASTWAVQAFAKMGDHGTALEIFRGMLPSLKTDRSHYTAEPYVMPGNVDGPDSPLEGRAGWTWYTGSAAWMQRILFDTLCGVKATRRGLVIDSQASGLTEFRLQRLFRGDRFQIEVQPGEAFAFQADAVTKVEAGIVATSTATGKVHEVKVRRAAGHSALC